MCSGSEGEMHMDIKCDATITREFLIEDIDSHRFVISYNDVGRIVELGFRIVAEKVMGFARN